MREAPPRDLAANHERAMHIDDDASQGVAEAEPVAQPDTIASDPGQGQTQENREAPTEPEQGKEANEQPKANPPWFVTRIAKQRDDLAARDRRIAELEAAQRRPEGQDDQRQPRVPSQADYDRMVHERAATLVADQQFDAACNTIHDAGLKAYSDFGHALQTLGHLGALSRPLIEAAQETGEAAKVLYELGKNPEEAVRVLALPPTRMAVAVAKIASKAATPPPVSKAPPPNRPLQGRPAANAGEPDPSDTAAWIEKRNRDTAK